MPIRHPVEPPCLLIIAAAVRDAAGVNSRPGAVAVVDGRILAAGALEHVRRRLTTAPARTLELPDKLILPALVNAHAHLDLAAVGPQPFDGDFPAWLRRASAARPSGDADIAAAVRLGLRLSREQGVGVVGDIAFSIAAVTARLEDPMPGVSYVECFGPVGYVDRFRDRLDQMLDRIQAAHAQHPEAERLRIGISPHAPYTTSAAIYEHVLGRRVQHGYPLTTHLAETPEEDQFIRHARGFFVEHLKHYRQWSDATAAHGCHPVQWMGPSLAVAPWLVAHCNYVDDEAITLLARCGASVVYCPRASAYFGHPRPGVLGSDGQHRYRDMLAAGINVCLGTDSILCQPPDEAQPHGILAQMRSLFRRDRIDPATLLKMATVNGLRGLEMPPRDATLEPGAPARLATVSVDSDDPTDPLTQVLRTNAPLEPVVITAEA